MERARKSAEHHFLVELAAGGDGWTDVADVTFRARSAVDRAREHGNLVTFVRSVYAPESDTLFLVYRAATHEAVVAATRDADLRLGPISPALPATDGRSPMD